MVYGNTFGLGFALDAVGIVQGDPRVHAVTAENLAHIFQYDYWWPSSVDTLYRPFTTLSFLFNYAVLGNADKAAGYHVLNVLLHMANVVLVFQLSSRLLGDRASAFFAAALWSVHPVLTESVANIAGRADLLATLAVLGGLLLYDRILSVQRWRGSVVDCSQSRSSACSPKKARRCCSVSCCCGTWFAARAGLEEGRGEWRRMRPSRADWPSCWRRDSRCSRRRRFRRCHLLDNPLRGRGFLVARWTAIKMIGMDLLLLVWPVHLSSERVFAQIVPAAFSDAAAWLALAVSAAILTAVIARYRKDRPLFWAAGMFAIALLPVSNLVLLIGATMAERFLYLPSVGFAIAAAALLYRLKERIPVRAVAMVLVALLAVRTFARNFDWKDNLTLAQADVSSAPRSARLQEMLASSLFAQDPARNLDAAIAHGEAAWEILRVLPPGRIYQQTPARLGAYYRMKGDAVGPPANREWYQKSAAVLERARESSQAIEKAYDQAQLAAGKPLATRVAYQPLYADLGLVYLKLSRYGEAVEALRYGREVDPRTPALYDLLAAAYSAGGQPRQAAATVLAKVLLLGRIPRRWRKSGVYTETDRARSNGG